MNTSTKLLGLTNKQIWLASAFVVGLIPSCSKRDARLDADWNKDKLSQIVELDPVDLDTVNLDDEKELHLALYYDKEGRERECWE